MPDQQNRKDEPMLENTYIIAGGVLLLIMLLVIIVLICLLIKEKKTDKSEKEKYMNEPLLSKASSDFTSVCLTDLDSKSKSGPIVIRDLGEVDVPQQDEDDF